MLDGASSVTEWLIRVRASDPVAEQRIWERYFHRLVRQARRYLHDRVRRAADEEDVALNAMFRFFQSIRAGAFPDLRDRDGLWRLLLALAERQAGDLAKHERRQKRGGGQVRGDSALAGASSGAGGFGAVADPALTPATAAQLTEAWRRRLQQLEAHDPLYRRIAELRMAGHTNEEIAAAIGKSVATVERKLNNIRQLWRKAEPAAGPSAGLSADSVAARLALAVMRPSVEHTSRLVLARGDTPTPRCGPHTQGAGVRYNPARWPVGPFVYSHDWAVLGLLAAHPAWGVVSLPLLARLYVRAKALPGIDPRHRPPSDVPRRSGA